MLKDWRRLHGLNWYSVQQCWKNKQLNRLIPLTEGPNDRINRIRLKRSRYQSGTIQEGAR